MAEAGVGPETRALPALGARRRLALWMASDLWVLALSVAYFLLLLPLAPDLGRPSNLQLIFSNALPLSAVALGQTLVLVAGGIDLSVTSIIALCSVSGAWAMTGWGLSGGAAFAVGALVMGLVGVLVGVANGQAVTRLGMPPFMVTLATMMFGGGLAIWATRSRGIPGLPEPLAVFAQEGLGPLPWAALLVVPLILAAHFVLSRTVLGRWLYAVGANAKAARVSGVPVDAVIRTSYVLCGVCAAAGALLYTGRLETGSPVLGQRIFLDVIGAAVIGGTSLLGGRGSVLGTVFGVLFITLIDNSLNILGLSSFTILMAKGGVILLAAWADVARARRARRGGGA